MITHCGIQFDVPPTVFTYSDDQLTDFCQKAGITEGCDIETIASDGKTPPEAYYDTLLEEATQRSLKRSGRKDVSVLYLAFNGTTLKKGFSRGQSFILCRSEATIPASGYSPDEQREIINRVTYHYERAGVLLIVTGEKPTSGDYTTAIVGGTYQGLGCQGPAGIIGVAPLDIHNVNQNDIVFSFTSRDRFSVRLASDVIAHEAGHSYGLYHISENTDIMYPFWTANVEAFKSGYIVINQNGQLVETDQIQDEPKYLRLYVGDLSEIPAGSEPWTNPSNPVDINNDKCVTAVDALILLNAVNKYGNRQLPAGKTADFLYWDSNADGMLSALDVLLVINSLNSKGPYCY